MCYPKQKISLPWSKKYVIGRRQLPQRQTKSYQETEINIKVMFQLFHVCMTYLINIHKFCLLEIVHMSYYSSKQFEKTHMSNIFPIILLILSLFVLGSFWRTCIVLKKWCKIVRSMIKFPSTHICQVSPIFWARDATVRVSQITLIPNLCFR